jgi:tetratricopeptide (TPR) repeat protein
MRRWLLASAALMLACQGKPDAPPVDVAALAWPTLSLSQVDDDFAAWLRTRQEELRQQVLADPTDRHKAAKVFGELGLILDAWEQNEDALLCYRNAGSIDPKNPRWPHLEALVHRDAGRGEEALELFRKALEIDPANAATVSYLAELELDRGELEVAKGHFAALEKLEPGNATAHHGLGQIALQQGRPEEAVEHFHKALESQPTANRVRYPLSQALREAGRGDEAAEALARAGRVRISIPDPTQQLLADVRAQTALRLVGDMAANLEGVTDLELLRFTLTQLSRTEGAIEGLQATLAAVDQAAKPRVAARLEYAIAGLDIYAGRDREGVERLRRAVQSAPDMAEAWLKLGNALARLGDLKTAEEAFTKAVELDPSGDALLARATIKLNRRDGSGALADLRRLAAARPADGVVRVRIAEAREVMGDLQGAFAELQAAAGDESLEPAGRARAARGLGDFLIRRARHDQAVVAYRRALDLDPTSTAVRTALAEVLGHLGRWPEAVAEFEKVIVEQPANEQARRGELVALVLQRQWDLVGTRLREGLAQLPDSGVIGELGARFYAACPDPAQRNPKQALDLAFVAWNERETATRADAVAIAWAASGRFAEALEWQDRAVRMGFDPAEAAPRLAAYRKSEAWVAATPIELLGFPTT